MNGKTEFHHFITLKEKKIPFCLSELMTLYSIHLEIVLFELQFILKSHLIFYRMGLFISLSFIFNTHIAHIEVSIFICIWQMRRLHGVMAMTINLWENIFVILMSNTQVAAVQSAVTHRFRNTHF